MIIVSKYAMIELATLNEKWSVYDPFYTYVYELKMANGRDNVSETFKLQNFEAVSTIRKSRKHPDGKAIQEYINNNSAGNISESFVLENLRILVDQNILLNEPTFFEDSYYVVKSNCSDKCNIPIDCDIPLNVMHKNMQGENDKNTNSTYPKIITVTQDTSTNTSNCIDKDTDSYIELVLKSLKDHIFSLENQLTDKQYIIDELFKKVIKAFVTASLPIVTL